MLDSQITDGEVLASGEGIQAPQTLRIAIRPFRPEDSDAMFLAIRESVSELCQWMVWCKRDYSPQDSVAFISQCTREWIEKKSFSFVIVDSEDGTFLGSVGLNGIDPTHKFANVGCWVRTDRTRKGICSTAIRLIAQFAFSQTDLKRLEFVVPVGNAASQRAVEKSGAVREGLLRNRVLLNGASLDALMYSIVRDEFYRGATATVPAG